MNNLLFNFFTNEKWDFFCIFYQANVTGGVGYLNKNGAEIGYM